MTPFDAFNQATTRTTDAQYALACMICEARNVSRFDYTHVTFGGLMNWQAVIYEQLLIGILTGMTS